MRPRRRWFGLPLPPVLPQRSRADQAGRGASSYWLAAVSTSSEQLRRPRLCSSVPRLVLSAVRVPGCQRPLRYTDTSAAWPPRPHPPHGGSALTTTSHPPSTSAPSWRAGPWHGACMRPRREALACTQAAFRGCSPRPSRASRPCSGFPNLQAMAASAAGSPRLWMWLMASFSAAAAFATEPYIPAAGASRTGPAANHDRGPGVGDHPPGHQVGGLAPVLLLDPWNRCSWSIAAHSHLQFTGQHAW